MDNPINNSQSKHPETPEKSPNPSHSKKFKWLILGLVELILMLGAFSLGTSVGFRKAGYTYSWAKNYANNFGEPRRLMTMPPPPQFFNAHGLDGTILTLGIGSVIIKDEDNNEKTIAFSTSTTIRQNFQTLKPADLKTGEEIIVIGAPNNQGQIDAKLVRVLNPQ